MRSAIVNLEHRTARDPRQVGGKGAGLARLLELGFATPPGFVVATSVFDEIVAHLKATSGSRSDGLATGQLPAAFERRLLVRARKLAGSFAVRSSLVGEDSAQASMAGQLATSLDVTGDAALLTAVKQCYASAFDPRLATYRRHVGRRGKVPAGEDAGAGATESPLAVIVQRMQPSHTAGVAFSADPVTGQRCVIIEAAGGRPDAVVSGRVNPARWRVDARGVLIESSEAAGAEALLSPARILDLAGAVRRIAARVVDPVDVEWLWDGERFWFVQARPITTLIGRHVYSNRLVSDMSPGLVKPLLWSTNTLGMTRNVFGRIFDALLGPTGLDYGRLARRIHSRLYTDVTMLGELLVRAGFPANLFEVMARDEQGERPRFHPSTGQLLRLRRLAPFLWRYLRAETAIRLHLSRQDAALTRYRDAEWRGRSLSELFAHARELQALHGQSQWFIFLAAINSMVRKRILDRMVRRHAPEVDAGDLIRGLSGLKALEPNRRLQELAVIARGLPAEHLDRLREGEDARFGALLATTEPGRRLQEGFAAFLSDYGFLSANGTDISSESWVERPELVWQMVARNVGGAELRPAAEAEAIRREARRRVRASLHPLQRGVFARLLRSTVVYLNLRERVSLLLSEDAYQMRRVFLAIGEGLVASVGLDTSDDVFYFYIDELERLTADEFPASEARDLVRRRRAEMSADAEIHPEETICGDTPPSRLPEPGGQVDHLVGIGGSSGVVEGRARIVRDPLDAPDDLGSEDVLIVPFTDVGWTPLFAGIGGIVAETGGQLSHTAIVAREYNLPAVVSVPNATRRLRENQAITLDGRSGRVYLGHVLDRKELRT